MDAPFLLFQKALMNLEQCRSWIKACARLNGNKIGHPNYVCSKIRTLFIFFSVSILFNFFKKNTLSGCLIYERLV